MIATELFWLVIALLAVAVVVPLAFLIVRRQPARQTVPVRTAWLVAATTSGTVLVFIATKVGSLIPNATAVDVGALAVTGVLTGAFLALGLSPGRS